MLKATRRAVYSIFCCGWLIVIGCTSSRPTPVRVAFNLPTPPQTVSPADPSVTTLAAQTVREEAIERLLEESEEIFRQGKAQFAEQRYEEGRASFRRALDLLRNAGYDFSVNPVLEEGYYHLLNRVQSVELEALLDTPSLDLFPIEPAPLDEIAAINLYTLEVPEHLRQAVSQDLMETRFDIPVVLNDEVLRFLNYYQNRGRRFMEQGLSRSGRYLPLFRQVFRREGVPLDLVYMAHIESNFRPRAVSRARATGLWQFMSGTGALFGLEQNWWIDERSDVLKSTEAAARFLKELYAQFGDWHLALAAYNVGPGRVERILNRHGDMDYWTMVRRRLLPRETSNYVPSILASLIIFRNPERYGFSWKPEAPIAFERVPVREQFDVRVLAEVIDVPASELLELNPELTRGVTPGDSVKYFLKVPPGTAELLEQGMASIPPEKRLRFQHHRVKSGETLSLIARRYSSSIQAIAEVNRIANIHRLSLGQDLLIPVGLGPQARGVAALAVSLQGSRPESHVVRRGESPALIARRYGIPLENLLLWNNLRSNSIIHPGQRIRLQAQTEIGRLGSERAPAGER